MKNKALSIFVVICLVALLPIASAVELNSGLFFENSSSTITSGLANYNDVPEHANEPLNRYEYDPYYDNPTPYNDLPNNYGTPTEPTDDYGNGYETPGSEGGYGSPYSTDTKGPMRYKDGKIAPEETREQHLPIYDPTNANNWRYEWDYKNNRPFNRGYYDEKGFLKIRDDFTDHGFPERDYPGHRHRYEPIDPNDPSKGVRKLPGKEPIPRRKLP